ncbi:MAG TPA: heme biosynthesis HemY N-terminal domain-containing protein [Casimicrobiaceae bacterium]|nr:heme biosynthesis HemY N-terminal domain-containing protein [Casimicrobiaceae bacterium]
MRILFWFLLVAAAAVAVALGAKIVSGYVLFVAPPYRVELSLNLFLVLGVAAFVACYALVRLAMRTSGMPAEVRAMRRRQREARSRSKLDAAVVALLEGRYGKARQFAEEALDIPDAPGIAALVAARAALDTRDYATAEAHLTGQAAQAGSLAVPRMMLDAEMKLEQRRPLDALAVLQALRREAGSHTAALRLELRALQGAGRYAEIPALVDQLVKRKVYGPDEGAHVRAVAHAEELAARANDPAGLRAYWSKLGDAEQRLPRIARAAAKSFLALGNDREAADILARSLEREWVPDLVLLYAQCKTPDPTKQIAEAEAWLVAHDKDALLLRALGTLCARAELWGKAQTYFEASLALDDGYEARVALGELLARTGRTDAANAQLATALELALAELRGRG